MRKIYKAIILLLLSTLIIISYSSCQNVFGSSTDSERVYGQWIYQKDNGSGIKLDLNKDGTYYYEEFSSSGRILYSSEGKYSLSATRLILKDIDTEGGDRYSIYSISMKNSTEDMDILDLVPTMTKKFSFKRVMPVEMSISAPVDNIEQEAIHLDIEGEWQSSDFGKINIKGNNIFVELDNISFTSTIEKIDGNNLSLSFSDDIVIDDSYSEVSYFVVNDALYVVFPKLGSNAIAFISI